MALFVDDGSRRAALETAGGADRAGAGAATMPRRKSPVILALIGLAVLGAGGALAQSSGTPSARPGETAGRKAVSAAAQGEPSGLRLDGAAVVFCDTRGGRKLDLATGEDIAFARACPDPDKPNVACTNLGLTVDIRSPPSEPNDTADLAGWSVPFKGKVQDCAADGALLAVATTSGVVVIDTARKAIRAISREGGDRIAVGSQWVVWSKGERLRAAPLP